MRKAWNSPKGTHKDELRDLELTHKAKTLGLQKGAERVLSKELLDLKDECIASLRSEIKAKDETLAISQQRLNEIEDALSR